MSKKRSKRIDAVPVVDFDDEAGLKRGLITAALRRIREMEGDGPRLNVSWLDVEAAVDEAVRQMYGSVAAEYEVLVPVKGAGVLGFRVAPFPD